MSQGWTGPPVDPPPHLGGAQGGGGPDPFGGGGYGGGGYGGGAYGGEGFGRGSVGNQSGDAGAYEAPYQPGSLGAGPSIGFDTSGAIDRPGSVTAALAIAIICGGLGAGLSGLILLGGAMFGAVGREIGTGPGEGSAQAEAWSAAMGAVGLGITVIGLLLLAWCIAQVVLAILALRPRNGVRFALVVMTAAAGVFQFLGAVRSLMSGDTFPALVGLCLAIVLAAPAALLLGRDANLYYASTG